MMHLQSTNLNNNLHIKLGLGFVCFTVQHMTVYKKGYITNVMNIETVILYILS